MNRIFALVGKLENIVAHTALAILVLCVLWGVLTRYITATPAVWTAELSGILFTWVVFIGAASVMRRDHHISVPILVDMLPPAARRIVRGVGRALMVAFLIYVTWLSYQMMLKGASRVSPVLRIPFSWVYLASFLAFFEMSISSSIRLFGTADAATDRPKSEII